jgi:excisionase family DNA binding protein
MERLTVGEAAERLEISEDAVRKRVQRGTLPHAKQDGRVYVYLDSEMSTVGQNEGMELDEQVTLNYIDKLYTAWQALSASHKRYSFLALVIPVLVLALSGGAIFPEERLTFLGIGLRVPLAVLMVTGAILIPILLVMVINLESLSTFYEKEINSLYQSRGLTKVIEDSTISPFVGGGILDVIGFDYALRTGNSASADGTNSTGQTSVRARAGSFLIHGFYLILPTAAQVGAGYKVSELLDKAEPAGWFAEGLAYIGTFMGAVLHYAPWPWPEPQQSSDWVSSWFVFLALATALVYLPTTVRNVLGVDAADAREEVVQRRFSRPKLVTVLAYIPAVYWLIFMATLGMWLGYIVATI